MAGPPAARQLGDAPGAGPLLELLALLCNTEYCERSGGGAGVAVRPAPPYQFRGRHSMSRHISACLCRLLHCAPLSVTAARPGATRPAGQGAKHEAACVLPPVALVCVVFSGVWRASGVCELWRRLRRSAVGRR
jgi:hypothetical protein